MEVEGKEKGSKNDDDEKLKKTKKRRTEKGEKDELKDNVLKWEIRKKRMHSKIERRERSSKTSRKRKVGGRNKTELILKLT